MIGTFRAPGNTGSRFGPPTIVATHSPMRVTRGARMRMSSTPLTGSVSPRGCEQGGSGMRISMKCTRWSRMSDAPFSSVSSFRVGRMLGLTLLCAVALLKTASAQAPDLARLSAQGQAALRDQQFDRAAEIYEQILKLDPRSA